MITKRNVSRLVFAFLLTSLLVPVQAVASAKKVAVIPFKMNTDRDLTFLQEGIVDMLSTRMSWENKVTVLPKAQTRSAVTKEEGPLNEAAARRIGRTLGADYVLFGSLTVFGESVSMDAMMVDVQGKEPTISVFDQSQGMDGVIPKVNSFAAQINAKVFGRQVQGYQQPPTATAPTQRQAPKIYDHPEKLLMSASGNREISGLNPNFITAGRRESATFWKSRNFPYHIKSMAIGDVDGDGLNEVVFCTQTQVSVYRNDNNQFKKIREIHKGAYVNYLGVDVADINGNGKDEIFVTNLISRGNNQGERLESFVLEWNGTGFDTITEKNNWYFRVIDIMHRGKVLYGQRRGISKPFLGDVQELTWMDSEYQPSADVRLPKKFNVFGFAVGDVLNDRSDRILAFDSQDHLHLLTPGGGEEWKSDTTYGGSLDFVHLNMDRALSTEEEDRGRRFLGQRIFVKDLNEDGQMEVLVVRNEGTGSRLFSRMRNYTSSEIMNLSWDGLGLTLNWKTRKIHGYVSDYAIDDFDNDGENEMVAVVVISKGVSLLKEPKSAIISYDLVGLKEDEGEAQPQ